MSSRHHITGRLIEEEELEHDDGIKLLQDELLFTEANARAEVKKQCGAHVSYSKLKRHYESLWNRCNQLVEPTT